MDGYSKFYNRMEFTINLRKVWEPGSPAIRVPSGGIVEGPYEKLIHYRFLAPLPFDFHKVDSTTTENFSISQEIPVIKPEDIKIQNAAEQKTAEPESNEGSLAEQTAPSGQLPFDPAKVNWIQVKTAELEVAAKVLGIDLSALKDVPAKKKKWELVSLVKAKLGIIK